MGALLKIVIGLVLLLVGLVMFADGVIPGLIPNNVMVVRGIDFGAIDWLGSFITILQGFIPAFIVLVGLFMVWLEADELKMQKELEKEEKAEAKGKPEPKKKK